MKLYLDDSRPTPEGWVRTYSVNETIEALQTRTVTHLSVDNDLGSTDPKTEGFNVLDWLERKVFEDLIFPLPEITVHSFNEGRKPYMLAAIRSMERIRQQQIGGG